METKYIQANITKADDGSFIAVASTNSIDRHGEVVDNNGWDLKAFKKNPVILWAHDHTEPAIGVSKKTWVEGVGKKAKLMIQPILHDVTEKAKAIKTLVEMGVINSLSVGFKPIESPDGITFTKNELLEVSMVNVPANADAMAMAFKGLKQKGFSKDTIKEVLKGAVQDELDEDAMWEQKQQNMEDVFEIFYAFCDAYFDIDTSPNDFKMQLDETIGLLTKVSNGSYQDPDDNMEMSGKVIDKLTTMEKDIDELKTLVKAPQTVNPKDETKIIRYRLSMNKVIAKAADKLLEADKKAVPVDHKSLIKVIKRANELITVAEKGRLDG